MTLIETLTTELKNAATPCGARIYAAKQARGFVAKRDVDVPFCVVNLISDDIQFWRPKQNTVKRRINIDVYHEGDDTNPLDDSLYIDNLTKKFKKVINTFFDGINSELNYKLGISSVAISNIEYSEADGGSAISVIVIAVDFTFGESI